MTEACQGGESLFDGFFAENAHFVTDECAPYKPGTRDDKCSDFEKCPPHSKIKKTYWIGKGYGDSSERKMMKEIIRNGAVIVGIKAPSLFN